MPFKSSILYIFLFGFFLQVSTTIIIKSIEGIKSARLGANTTTTTIKCNYEYENENAIVVKWFFNETILIAQWIPDLNKKPAVVGPFKDILDANEGSITFKEIRKDLTGYYTCLISSAESEISKTEFMVPYKPPAKVEFSLDGSTNNLMCSVYGIYPKPVITFVASHESGSVTIKENEMEVNDIDEGLYKVKKEVSFDDVNLEGSSEFVCNISIPNTSFSQTIVTTINY